MRLYRIADHRHEIWDGTGAALCGGRWNSPGHPVIYGSLSYSGAMLETLARTGIGRIPHTQRFVIVEVPDGIDVERLDQAALPSDWDAEDSQSARSLGDRWLEEMRSAVMLVPSVVARLELNAIVNPRHPDASRLLVGQSHPVIWDRRLFERPR